MSEKTVFISYSHDTTAHSRRVLELANVLRSQGVDVELDQYHVRPPQGWPRWCEEQLRPDKAAFVLVICTDIYRQRVEGRTAADEGRGVFWEGRILYNYLYDEKSNKRFIPVLLDSATEDAIPQPLRGDTRYRLKPFDLSVPGYLALYRELTAQPVVIKPPVGALISLPPDGQSVVNPLNPLPPRQVLSRFIPAYISPILKYAPEKLIGREAETKLLKDAWAKARKGTKKRPHVLTFVALGGEGKTSLVAKWAADLAHQDWPGCDAVFAWSFYSQGTREQTAASSDAFLKEALSFFGDAEMAASAQGAFDKGRRLARLVGERRALLILDGVEPLQYAPTSPTPGELKDQGLAALLKGLAATGQGLCIVTTRYSISDLRAYWQTTAPEVKLPRLSQTAGVALLKNLGVKGTQKELEKLVEDVKGHALTLNLLGTYLRDAHAGDIRKRDLVDLEEASDEQGGDAFRVIDAYVRWFESEGEKGKRALAVLRLLGLFDRPATADCLSALLKAPAIPDLTEALVGLSEAQRNVAYTRLEAAKLLIVNRDGRHAGLAGCPPATARVFRQGAPNATL
ncbi:MAG: SEFIR domain-containing protein [Gammaproteobacteria bacterium]